MVRPQNGWFVLEFPIKIDDLGEIYGTPPHPIQKTQLRLVRSTLPRHVRDGESNIFYAPVGGPCFHFLRELRIANNMCALYLAMGNYFAGAYSIFTTVAELPSLPFCTVYVWCLKLFICVRPEIASSATRCPNNGWPNTISGLAECQFIKPNHPVNHA